MTTLPARPDCPHLRVATLNVLHNSDTWLERAEAVAAAVAVTDADVVCLQEVLAPDASPLGISAADQVAALAGYPHVATAFSEGSGVAVLSRHPLDSVEPGLLPSHLPGHVAARDLPYVTGTLTAAGRTWQVTSTHLAWHGENEHVRFRQASFLADRLMLAGDRVPGTISVLGGDFNSFPDSVTSRFMRGLEVGATGAGTHWLDAFLEAHKRERCTFAFCAQTCGATVTDDNPWAIATATRHGIRTDLLGSRRIDYIYVRTWYGKPGQPLTYARFADTPGPGGVFASDHYGALADLLA